MKHLRIVQKLQPWVSPSNAGPGPRPEAGKIRPGTGQRPPRITLPTLAGALVLLGSPTPLSAQPNLVIDEKPLTWHIIGLQHNNVTIGPNRFPVGVRVHNTGDSPATSVSACLEWTGGTGADYVSLADSDCVSTPSIAPGAFADFYFTVQVARTSAAFGTTRDYKITVSADPPVVSQMETGQLYVEGLIDQNRNAVLELMGPDEVTAGEIRTFILTAETATGYDQLTCFVDFPNTVFRILSVESTYSIGGTNDKQYADACGWDRNPASPTYMSCIGPPSFASGKAGGAITSIYKVEILQNVTEEIALRPLILDKSGGSFHYNSDFGQVIKVVKPQPLVTDVAVVKSDIQDPVETGSSFEYVLTVMNVGDTTATDVVLTDTLPLGVSFIQAIPPADSGPNPLLWELGDMPPSTQTDVTVYVQANCDGIGTILNTAGVMTSTAETELNNNLTTEATVIIDTEPPQLTCQSDVLTTAAECESTASVVLAVPDVSDNCTPNPVVSAGSRSDGKSLSDPYPVGETQVTWTAMDDSGNSTSCTVTVVVAPSECNGCTLSQGFWMTHPDEWPVSELMLGNRLYSKTELLSILGQPVQMNGLVLLARQLIAAKLNIANGANPSDISVTIAQADALIGDLVVPPVGDDQLDPSEVSVLADVLNDYNTGIIGPGQCPDDRDVCMIECPEDITTSSLPGECGTTVPYLAMSIGYCPGAVLVCEPPPGSFFPVGTTVVTCRLVHPTHGMQVECSFTVTVTDPEPPVLVCPPDLVVEAASGQCSAEVDYVTEVSDNCTTVELVCEPEPGTVFSVGVTTVTCTATDASGNVTSCSFTVTVIDTQPPVVICPADKETTASGCETSATVSIDPPTAQDNCDSSPEIGVPVRSDGQPLESPFPLGTTTITWTATDDAGNMTTCTTSVTVHSGVCPQPGDCLVICPDDMTTDTLPGQCSAVVYYDVTLEGLCDETTVVCTPPPGFAFPIGTTSVVCQVISLVDPPTAGSQGPTVISECSFKVTVRDAQPPQIECPPDIRVAAEPGHCDTAVDYQVTASDLCSSGVLVTCDPPSGFRFPVGTTTVTCTATDQAGNVARCTFEVTVDDTEGPEIMCPGHIILPADPDQCSKKVDYVTTATDLCSSNPVTLECIPPPGTVFPVGTTPVTCVATDSSGNQTSCTFTVTIRDMTPPVLTCPQNIETTATGCETSVTVSLEPPDASDNCVTAPVAVSFSRSDGLDLFEPFSLGVTLVTWTATDASGNAASCTVKVTVHAGDCPEPVPCEIECPPDIVVEADPQLCGAIVSYTVNLTGDCEGTTIVCTPPPGSVFPVGTTVVRCHIEFPDGGHFAMIPHQKCECVFTVTVLDPDPPQIKCPHDIVVDAEPGHCDALVTYSVQASDPCTSDVQVTCVPPPGTRFPVGTHTVVCVATDGSGNSSYCSFTVTVRDTQAPRITCPPDKEVTADGCETSVTVPLQPPTATDDCTTSPVISMAIRSDGMPLDAPYPLGTTTVTWTVTDSFGNTASCTAKVTVDRGDCPKPLPCPESPKIVCPPNIVTVPDSGRCDALVDYQASATDDCTTDLVVICTPPPGTRFPIGVTLVTCTVTDATSRTASCSFTVTVLDNTPPQITCPSDIVVDAETGQCDAEVFYVVVASDSCTSEPSLSCFPPPGHRFPVGVTTVYCVATDSSGNSAQCTFTVTVRDRQAPVINCPADITVDARPDCCDAVVDYKVTATDNCPGLVGVVCTPPPGSAFPVGTTPVVCIAIDSAGNTSRCSFVVTVRDTTPPVIICPPDMMVDTCPNCCEADVDYMTTATDNCEGEILLECTPPPGAIFPLGLTQVVCTATDASGNQTTCSFFVNVCDHVAPEIQCPADITVTAPACSDEARVSLSRPTVSDACTFSPLITRGIRSDTRGLDDPYPLGETTITWAAVDTAGNVATCSSRVRVLKGQCAPCSITCPSNLVVAAEPGRADAVVTFSPRTSGHCNGTAITCVPPSGSRFPVGTTTVTCTATLPGGSSMACTFTVTVLDQEAPVLVCPPVLSATASGCETTVLLNLFENLTVSDNSGKNPEISAERSDGRPLSDPYPLGLTSVTVTATDGAGNSATCSLTVDVAAGDCLQPSGGCTMSLDVCRNRSDRWPVDSLRLGNRTYTKNELLAILNQPVNGNRLVRLAQELIVAKMNVAAGADPSAVSGAITQADALIGDRVVPPLGTGSLQAKYTADLHITLGRYNMGHIGPGPCQDF